MCGGIQVLGDDYFAKELIFNIEVNRFYSYRILQHLFQNILESMQHTGKVMISEN